MTSVKPDQAGEAFVTRQDALAIFDDRTAWILAAYDSFVAEIPATIRNRPVAAAVLEHERVRLSLGLTLERPRLAAGADDPLLKVIDLISVLPADDQRAVAAYLARAGRSLHMVRLKEAAAHFRKSEAQCVRRAIALRKQDHIFGIKIGKLWYFNILNPPPDW